MTTGTVLQDEQESIMKRRPENQQVRTVVKIYDSVSVSVRHKSIVRVRNDEDDPILTIFLK